MAIANLAIDFTSFHAKIKHKIFSKELVALPIGKTKF